jgi:hypothetical protein
VRDFNRSAHPAAACSGIPSPAPSGHGASRRRVPSGRAWRTRPRPPSRHSTSRPSPPCRPSYPRSPRRSPRRGVTSPPKPRRLTTWNPASVACSRDRPLPGPADADLAEAVCALRWPNWPAYRGSLDLAEVRRALHGRRVDERTLTRLGGTACVRPMPAAQASEPPQRGCAATDRSARPRRRRRREVDDRAATAAVLRRT